MPDRDAGRTDPVEAVSLEDCIPSLRRYARSLTSLPHELDDLVHDCLVRALERLHTRRQDGDLRAWLFAIMHNLFVSRARQVRRRGTSETLDSLSESTLATEPSQEPQAEAKRVIEALDTLPAEQRTILVLVAVEGLSYADVALAQSIPIGTVMSRLSRARERLARAMEASSPAQAVPADRTSR